mgnify:CR=1 FL=1
MLLEDGKPKIMDFGITKMISSDATQTAAMLGTPSYMSPEQIDLEKVDGRSDLFSVGAMFYEMLCGKKAFHRPYYHCHPQKDYHRGSHPIRTSQPQNPSNAGRSCHETPGQRAK